MEYWFDFSCPYAYLGSTQLEPLAARASIHLRPMLLGGVFRVWKMPQHLAVAQGPNRRAYIARDLVRHAERFGVELHMPKEHPRRTVLALRAFLAAPSMRLFHRIFRAYWVEGLDVADREVMKRLLEEAGEDPARVFASDQREALARSTARAIELGVFGAPAFVIGPDLYWGQDHLIDVEEALGGKPRPFAPEQRIEAFVSLDSPASAIALELLERSGAEFRLTLVDGAKIAAAEPYVDNPAKQRWRTSDLFRQARRLGRSLVYPNAEVPTAGDARTGLRAIWFEGDVDKARGPFDPRDLEASTRRALSEGVFELPAFLAGGELYSGLAHLESFLLRGPS